MPADLGFGITAAVRSDHSRIGAELERLGYPELWVNDNRRGDGIATVEAIAPATGSLRFGVGVVALSEHSVTAIVERVAAANLPADRLTLGIGSGSSASLDLVRQGATDLRRLLPDVPIAVAAVGPRMSRLAGEVADAVVANWALPDRLAWVRERVEEGAEVAGRTPPRLVAYVRTAVDAGAADRLRAEMERYARLGRHYARAFGDHPDALVGVAVESSDPAELAAALAPYRSVVDTVVVRGLPTHDGVEGWLRIATLAAE
ncbi:MAG: LLM class flavin-dependent oxidoreductase [Chloroflexota bacterium]|nr:LLM class flavin-dependent oxidoreductase [Chloroflexota bacterium]